VFVSPFPVQLTNETIKIDATFELPNVGPFASDATILYKETALTNLNDFLEQTNEKIWKAQFPADPLAAQFNEIFYSPHLYMTVLLWNKPNSEVSIKYTLFAQIKQTKCSGVESSMGCYGEFLDAQCKSLTKTAVFIGAGLVAGNTFPTWKFGGIRPELMISGNTALRYFNRVAANQSQDMISRNEFQTAFKEATKMAAFDAGFGDPTVPLPDWVQILDVGGITSGAIRPYPPPLKFADNGNTLMF